MSTHDRKTPIANVSFVENSWTDHYDSGISYGLDLNGTHIGLDDENAEKVMLAIGHGRVVWTIDWKLVGNSLDHGRAIRPRIRQFVKGTVYETREEAEEAVNKELDARIAALQKLTPALPRSGDQR